MTYNHIHARKISGSTLYSKSGKVICDGIIAQGVLKPISLSVAEVLEIQKFLNNELLPSNVLSAQRILHFGRIFHTAAYSCNVKSNDSIVTLKDRKGVFELRKCLLFKLCNCVDGSCMHAHHSVFLLNVLTVNMSKPKVILTLV